MASSDTIDSMHRNIWIFEGVGSLAALLGLSSYLMSYEYKDFDRVNIQGQDNMEDMFHKRRKTSMAIMIVCAFVYVAGIVCISLGISLYRDERQEVAGSIPGMITQIRQQAAQPTINEPAILSGLSSALLVIGMAKSAWDFNKTEQWGWIGSTLYAAGWIGNSFAAAMGNMSITSLETSRLAWTLPGAAAIVGGTFLYPWQLHFNYIGGPAFVIQAAGYVCLTIGTGYVTPGPS